MTAGADRAPIVKQVGPTTGAQDRIPQDQGRGAMVRARVKSVVKDATRAASGAVAIERAIRDGYRRVTTACAVIVDRASVLRGGVGVEGAIRKVHTCLAPVGRAEDGAAARRRGVSGESAVRQGQRRIPAGASAVVVDGAARHLRTVRDQTTVGQAKPGFVENRAAKPVRIGRCRGVSVPG